MERVTLKGGKVLGAADAMNGLVSADGDLGAGANKKPEARQQADLDSYRGTN